MSSNIHNKTHFFICVLLWVLVSACMIVIYLLSSQIADESAKLSNEFLAKIMELFNITMEPYTIRKIAHGLEYFGLAILIFNASYQTWQKSKPYFSFIFTLLFAISDEIHQIFVPGRACRFFDVCVDSIGAIAGILLCLSAVYIINKLKRRRKLCKEKPTK
ncbi:MAG: VanZ family protein [Eubacteriales bacterium]